MSRSDLDKLSWEEFQKEYLTKEEIEEMSLGVKLGEVCQLYNFRVTKNEAIVEEYPEVNVGNIAFPPAAAEECFFRLKEHLLNLVEDDEPLVVPFSNNNIDRVSIGLSRGKSRHGETYPRVSYQSVSLREDLDWYYQMEMLLEIDKDRKTLLFRRR